MAVTVSEIVVVTTSSVKMDVSEMLVVAETVVLAVVVEVLEMVVVTLRCTLSLTSEMLVEAQKGCAWRS